MASNGERHPIQRALEIAVQAHAGQTDKAGSPYILHPIRVMLRCASDTAKVVALLHDVVEDAPDWSLERLRKEGFSEDVVRGVDAVTRRKAESYLDFCTRAAADPVGRAVKRADLEDNMNVLRLDPDLSERDLKRIRKYRNAYEILR